MDIEAIKNKVIDIIEEAGFSSNTKAANAANDLSSSESGDVKWVGYEGFRNCAFVINNTKVLIWKFPFLDEDEFTCAFFEDSIDDGFNLENFDEENFRKIASDLKEKAVGVLKSRKKLVKERRIKMIEGLYDMNTDDYGKEFIELCKKYGLEDITGTGQEFGIETTPLFQCYGTVYKGTTTKCLRYDKYGLYISGIDYESLYLGSSLKELEDNIIACIRKYKSLKKEYKIKMIEEL